MTRLSMLRISSACAFALTVAAAPLSAQSYLGTWALVTVDKVSPDGHHVHLYGDDPQGIMTLDSAGRYTLQILRTGRPKFASGSKASGTPEENQQAVQGYSGEFGRYSVDDGGRTITFHFDHAFFPNWEGTAQRCELTVVGDRLTFIQPTTSVNDGSKGEVSWRRLVR